jgi:predicted DNA-binding protein
VIVRRYWRRVEPSEAVERLERLSTKKRRKNDLDIAREVLKVTKEVPIERAYDFSFAKKADSELTQAGWKP